MLQTPITHASDISHEKLTELVAHGDVDAMALMGMRLVTGEGGILDRVAGERMILTALEKGSDRAKAYFEQKEQMKRGDAERGSSSDLSALARYFTDNTTSGLFTRTVEHGHAPSAITLGTMINEGKVEGVPAERAFDLFRYAAELGSSVGAIQYGSAALKDDFHVEQGEIVRALRYVEPYIGADNRDALIIFGIAHEQGRGLSRSTSKALEFFRQAGELEKVDWYRRDTVRAYPDGYGCYRYGDMLAHGRAGRANYDAAYTAMKEAALRGYSIAAGPAAALGAKIGVDETRGDLYTPLRRAAIDYHEPVAQRYYARTTLQSATEAVSGVRHWVLAIGFGARGAALEAAQGFLRMGRPALAWAFAQTALKVGDVEVLPPDLAALTPRMEDSRKGPFGLFGKNPGAEERLAMIEQALAEIEENRAASGSAEEPLTTYPRHPTAE